MAQFNKLPKPAPEPEPAPAPYSGGQSGYQILAPLSKVLLIRDLTLEGFNQLTGLTPINFGARELYYDLEQVINAGG
jgi:hypothetical protein